MNENMIGKIYAGWLAKIIGIRYGAPIEGWSREKIRNVFGELDGYPVAYRQFAADDDSNGPLFFLRALEDGGHGAELTAEDVGRALLNYAPFEHGFFWWGGYGVSTEHTAYLNLFHGIPAPRSGSVAQNGAVAAEQIGGQIFIDTWGLVAPGNPALAARLAEKAASVTHGGNGIYGGMFVAACISCAFEETDITRIIETGLSFIPADCEYARAVRAVMAFHASHPADWRAAFDYVHDRFGYDRYPGNCHIIPNICVMIVGLLYGEGDFSRTLSITNMCGWDTDCNVGNVATIMGVRGGLAAIDYDKWRRPVNDLLICSSVVGSLNIMDIPYGAAYIAREACRLSGEEPEGVWKTILGARLDSCHFELPGSTHALRMRRALLQAPGNQLLEGHMENSEEAARTGRRSLKFVAKPLRPAEKLLIYKKTYYVPADFSDSRYDPAFSPLVYPGMRLHASVMVPEYGLADGFMSGVHARLYVHDARGDKLVESEPVALRRGEWADLSFAVPAMEGALLDEMGVCLDLVDEHRSNSLVLAGFIDDLYADGTPDYTLDLSREREEFWNGLHREVSQFTKLKGLFYLAGGRLHLSCADFGEAYTGRYDWSDYEAVFTLTPLTGEHHYVNIRVQGAMRSYAAGLLPGGRFALLKKDRTYRVLTGVAFAWEPGREYEVTLAAEGDSLTASVAGGPTLRYTDTEHPYRAGSIGLAVEHGSHMQLARVRVHGVSRKGA